MGKLNFNECSKLFKEENFSLLDNIAGDRYLKLRSLSRSKYIKDLLNEFNIDTNNMKVKDQLFNAFNSSISTLEIEEFIRKVYLQERLIRKSKEKEIVNELYKLKVFDWGGLHQNSLEKTIVNNYIKKIDNFEKLEQSIDNDLQSSLRGYTLCSWYNHWSSILIEDIFKDHPRILPALGLISKVDFFIDNSPYDLKVTYLPEGFITEQRKLHDLKSELTLLKAEAKNNSIPIDPKLNNSQQITELWTKLEEFSKNNTQIIELKLFRMKIINNIKENPNELIKWLYENQGIRRFDASNRFFIVLVNTSNFFEGWKMKRAIPLIKEKTASLLDMNKEIGRDIEFNWDTDNRDSQLHSLSTKIDDIGLKLGEQTAVWAKNRKDLDDIKINFLNKIRSYDSIS